MLTRIFNPGTKSQRLQVYTQALPGVIPCQGTQRAQIDLLLTVMTVVSTSAKESSQ